MAKEKKAKKGSGKVVSKLKASPLSYLSDLLMVCMVLFWIFDNIYETMVASAVTISSIVLSLREGAAYYDTSMWSSIGSNVAMPLTLGGVTWGIKNAGQHWIANSKGERAHEDFPNNEASENEDNQEEDGGTEQGIEFINLDDDDESEESV